MSYRVVICGNGGSGKSYLANLLTKSTNVVNYDLDALFWRDKHYRKTRPERKVEVEIAKIVQSKDWIVEGVYTHLLAHVVPQANILIWLDVRPDECVRNIEQRGRVSNETMRRRILEYYSRSTGSCWQSHLRLYQAFGGHKIYMVTRDEITAFVTSERLRCSIM